MCPRMQRCPLSGMHQTTVCLAFVAAARGGCSFSVGSFALFKKKIRKIGICFRVFVVFVKAWSHSFQVLRMPKRQKQKQRTMRAIPSGESFNGVRTPGYIFAFLSFRSFSPRCSKHVVFGGFYSMFF